MKLNDLIQVMCVVTLWGFNFVAIKLAVSDIPPLALTVLRFSITGLVLLPFFRLSWAQIKQVMPLAAVLGIGHFGLLFVGLNGADAATAALLIQLGVPFSSLLASVLFADHLGWKRTAAMALAFSGAALLAGEPQGGEPVAMIVLVVSAFCWAWANILIKKTQGIHPLAVMGWAGALSVPVLALFSALFETHQIQAMMAASSVAWMMLGYTIAGSSIIAYYLWYGLIGRLDVNQVVPFTLLAPVIGVGAGVMILGEELTVYKVIGGSMTLLGVAIIQWRQRAKKSPQ